MTHYEESDTHHDCTAAAAAAAASRERRIATDYDGFVLNLQYDRLTAQQHIACPLVDGSLQRLNPSQ